jgi:glucose-6-phosphate 1-dehydrogenase
VLKGEKSNDELDAAWKVFTPILHQIEGEKIKSEVYEFGSRGPKGLQEFVEKAGYKRDLGYVYKPTTKM